MNQLQELVSPAQARELVLVAAVVLSVLAGFSGWRAAGLRGWVGLALGPLVWGMWRFHTWITRYDPRTHYLGLDQVRVLALELVLFVGLGAVLGWGWSRWCADSGAVPGRNTEETE